VSPREFWAALCASCIDFFFTYANLLLLKESGCNDMHCFHLAVKRVTRWCRWLRHCVKSLMGSSAFFPDIILGSTHPLKEKITRNISWGVRRTVHRADLHVPIVLKSGILNLLEPSGPVLPYTVRLWSLQTVYLLNVTRCFPSYLPKHVSY